MGNHLKAPQSPHNYVLGERMEFKNPGVVEVVLIKGWNDVAQHTAFHDADDTKEFARVEYFVRAVHVKHAKKVHL